MNCPELNHCSFTLIHNICLPAMTGRGHFLIVAFFLLTYFNAPTGQSMCSLSTKAKTNVQEPNQEENLQYNILDLPSQAF